MTNKDFLSKANGHVIGSFSTPILNNEPIWAMLNVTNDVYAYALCVEFDLIKPIPLEVLSKMLSSGDINQLYGVIYLLDIEVIVKEDDCQRPSEKSEETLDLPFVFTPTEFEFLHDVSAKYTFNEGASDDDFDKLPLDQGDLLGVVFSNTLDKVAVYDQGFYMDLKGEASDIVTVYICKKKKEGQRSVSQNSNKPKLILDTEFCKEEHRLGNCDGKLNCSLCQDYTTLEQSDTIITPAPKPEKTVWDLDMHEEMFLQANFTDEHTEGYRYDVMRVPGGWIYVTGEKVTTFIPYVDQIHNTGCTLCGNSVDKTAQTVLEVLNKLNDETYTYVNDEELLKYVKQYLK